MTDRTDVSGPGATVSSAGLPPGGSRRQDPREAGAGLEPAHGQDSVAFRARRVRARVPFDVGEHVVVVGCGPVAARFVDDVLPLVERGLLRVTVLGAEPHMAYNRILVGEYAVGRVSRESLTVADLETWRAAGVDVRLGAEVLRMDRTRRRITVRVAAAGPGEAAGENAQENDQENDGASESSSDASAGISGLSWDRVVLATGARAVRPNLRGLDPSPDGAVLPAGVTALRDLDDARHMRAVVAERGHTVVLGGGVLGVEAALAAAETAGTATLVHTGDHPLGRVLSPGTARLLAERLRQAGVRCRSARAVAVATDPGGGFTALELADGGSIPGDLLVLSCGVQARAGLAEGAGLRVLQGIVVDHELQADVEGRVFAIGDCAEVLCRDPGCEPCLQRRAGELRSAPAGMIAPGWRQAEYLAARIAAEVRALADPRLMTGPVEPMPAHEPSVLRLKAKDIDLVVLDSGLPVAGDPARRIRFTDDALCQDLHAEFADDGRLRRAVALARPRAMAQLTAAVEAGEPLRGDLTWLLSLDSQWAAPEPAAAGPADVVCRCAGVTRGVLEEAIDGGARTAEAITAATRACTGCGTCHPEIQALLAQRDASMTT
ncbi:UNVERIFIED_CONTAM: FAD-dependent oxidoreductase [Kocuria sp. CPCC 205295]|uniref:NAD(P)/FAD-dependent oxidoreductase n=1 Tax=Kocuria coralli TaxID=1461025 RepID=A0A5J5KWI5_9MICC|nr:FAD-dependent oxidoreductase [Kocuria coralli]KAA9393758.1 NAD(P)/FAD-dependent oxidoreductase [Kocuria coralli]MDN5701484.1 FAD-dependent oxidoreductase [Micrococcales bacterium]